MHESCVGLQCMKADVCMIGMYVCMLLEVVTACHMSLSMCMCLHVACEHIEDHDRAKLTFGSYAGLQCIKTGLTYDSYVGLYVAGIDDCLRSLSAINAELHCSREPCQAGHQMIFAEAQIPVVPQQHIWQGEVVQ